MTGFVSLIAQIHYTSKTTAMERTSTWRLVDVHVIIFLTGDSETTYRDGQHRIEISSNTDLGLDISGRI
jgi:hypothetical protein